MYRYHDGHVEANGLMFHFLEWGDPDAPPVVLCHGTTGSAHAWDRISAALADRYRVIALDARNHGDSAWLDEPLSSTLLAGDLAGIVDALKLDRFGLIGHSMGGRQSMTYAASHADRLRWLVIEDIAPTAPPSGSADVASFLSGLPPSYATHEDYVDVLATGLLMPDREVLRERARHALRPLPDGRWQLKYHRAAGSGPTTGIDLWEALPRMTCPTLLLWGAASAIVNQELADRMVAGLPNGREVRIERAGHGVHMDNPTDFLAALDVFLAEVEAE